MLSGRRTLTLLLLLCLGHILLISSQVQSGRGQTALNSATLGTMATLQGGVAGLTDGIGRIWTNYFGLVGASRENEELRNRVLDLEGQASGRTGEKRARLGPRGPAQSSEKHRGAHAGRARDRRQPKARRAAGDDRSRQVGRRDREHGGHHGPWRGGPRDRHAFGACGARAAAGGRECGGRAP
jgi:hypothetical protein